MAVFDDATPARKPPHEIGMDLSFLSGDELTARIAILKDEIVRIEEERDRKRLSRDAAEGFFR